MSWAQRFRAWRWRRHHRPFALRLTFTTGSISCPDWEREEAMWREWDRMTSIYNPTGDLEQMEAIHDGTVLAVWP